MARSFRLASTAVSLAVQIAGNLHALRRITRAWHKPHFHRLKWLVFMLAASGVAAIVWLILMRCGADLELSSAHQQLELSSQDVDPESTALVLRLLRDNQVDGRLILALIREARPTSAGLEELSVFLKQGKVPPGLLSAAQTIRQALETGDASVYTVWVQAADPALRGSVFLSLDGFALGNFSVGQNRYSLSLLLKANSATHLGIRASSADREFVAVRGETANTEVATRRLRPGRSDEWVLAVAP